MTRPGLGPRPTGCGADALPLGHHSGVYLPLIKWKLYTVVELEGKLLSKRYGLTTGHLHASKSRKGLNMTSYMKFQTP